MAEQPKPKQEVNLGPVYPDDPARLAQAKMAQGQPTYDPITDTYKPVKPAVRSDSAIYNLVTGAFKSIPKMAEPERYVKVYSALEERQDKLMKSMEEARSSGPFSAALEFTYNGLRDAGDIATAAFILSDALGDAAEKSPEAVADFIANVPPAIAAGTYQVLSDFDESISTDPVGTMLTITGLGQIAKASKLSSFVKGAKAKAPEPIRSKAGKAFDGMDRFAAKVGNMKMEDVLNLSTPISRGEKVVGGPAARRRMDVPSGEEALKVGDVLKGAVVPTIVGLGTYGMPGAVTGLLGSSVIRTGVAAAKSAGPNVFGEYIAKLERAVKGTSRAQSVSEGVAKAHIMAESMKEGSKLQDQLNKIEDAIRNGDLDNAQFYMKDLDAPVPRSTVETTIRPGVYGDSATSAKTSSTLTGPQLSRRLPESIQRPLDDALRLIDNIKSGRSTFVASEINRIARLDSTVLLGSRSIRQGVIKSIEKQVGRGLSTSEAGLVTSKMNQMASLARLSNRDISGVVNVAGKRIDLNRSIQATMKQLQPKSQRDVILQAVGTIMNKEAGAVRTQSFINAIEDSAMGPVRNRKYAGRNLEDQLKEFVPVREGSRPAYVRADVLREYAEAIAESVVLRGNTVPLAMPRGVSFRQIRDILDNPSFQDYFRQKHGIARDNTGYNNAMKSLIKGMPNGVRIGDNATINIFKTELEDLRTTVADLKKSGGMLDDVDLKYIDDLEDSFKMQRGPRADKHGGPEVHPELAKTLDYVTNWKADSSKGSRILNTLAAVWKATRTIGSVGTGIINNLANSMVSSIENGVFIPQMYTRYVDEVVQSSKIKRGDTKGMSPDDLTYAKMTDEMGFIKGDMTKAEIQNFLRASDVNSVLSRGRLDKLVDEAAYWFSTDEVGNFLKQGAKSTGRGATKFYSSGDVVPKRVHAKAAMRESVDEVRRMEPGTVMFMRTNENAIRMFKRLDDGSYTYNGRKFDPNNLSAKQNKQFRDAIAANARRRANDRFVDFAQRPGLMRLIDRYGLSGALADPFITWGMKAKGIGGPNLISTVMGLNRPEYITNSAAVNSSLAKRAAGRRLRSAAILQSTKVDQASESKRKALDMLNSYASRTSLGTLIGLETEGMALTRDLGNLVSTNEAAKLGIGALQILASIFEEDPESAKALVAQGKPDTPVMNAVLNTLDVLGLATDATMIKIINDIVKNDVRKNQRAWRELRKTAMSTTGNEVFEYMIGLLKDNEVLPEWADEMLPTTYFDYIHRSVPKSQRPSRLRHFFVRNSGKLLAETTQVWSTLGDFGRMGKLERNADRIKKHLIKIYYDPVALDGTAEERVQAWTDIKDWYNGTFLAAARGTLDNIQKSAHPLDEKAKERFYMTMDKLFMADAPPLPSLKRSVRKRIIGQ